MAAGLVANLTLHLRALGLEALGGVKRGLDDVVKRGTKLQRALDIGAKVEQFAGSMDRISQAASTAVNVPVDKFKEFESAMARARSKMDEITGDQFARMKRAAMEAGATTAFSAAQAADGLGEMAAAGFTVQQQIEALPRVLQLAQAGEVGVGQATKIAASAMAQFGLKAKDIGAIGDTLLAASNASTIGLEEIAESLKYVGPIASAAGLSLKSTAGFVALLGNAGIEASSAGTALRGMIASMAAPTGKSKKALAELGLTAQDLAKGTQDPIAALKMLGERFDAKHYTQAQKLSVIMRVFGRETSAAVASLIDAGTRAGENGTAFESMTRAMNGSTGAMQRASDVLGETTEAKLKRLSAAADGLRIAAGEKLAPVLLQLADEVKPWLKATGDWIGEHPRAVAAFGKLALGVSAAAVAVKGFALAYTMFTTLAGPAQVAGRALMLPFVWVSGAASNMSAILGINGAVAAAAGQSYRASALNAGALAVKLAAVAAAAYAGYEAGKLLDSALGKALDARGGKLSTEAALQAGESSGVNRFVGGVGNLFGIQALKDAAAGNAKRNADERAATTSRGYANQVASPQAQQSPATGQFNAVTGQIEVKVTDDRVTVKNISRGPVRLRTGSTPVGAR